MAPGNHRLITKTSGTFGIPIAALAALPACPACYPAYAGVLSALGLGGVVEMGPRGQAILTVLFLAGALGALAFRARTRRGYAPLALGVAASLVVMTGKFLLLMNAATYAGVGGLMAAAIWNVWPRAADTACVSCAPADGTPAANHGA